MKRVVQNVWCTVAVLLCACVCLETGRADDDFISSNRTRWKALSPAETQLKLVETLLRQRMTPLELKKGTPLNKVLNHIEQQFAESGKELKFVRAASDDDFTEPLADQKLKYDCTIAAGNCAEVLAAVCHEAGCGYCVRDGEVHVFPYASESGKEYVLIPKQMRSEYFNSGAKGLTLRSPMSKKFPLGRVRLQEDKDFRVSMTGTERGRFRARTSLNGLYAEWVKKNDWAYYKNKVAKSPRFVADTRMNEQWLVPTVFPAPCNLEVALKYFALHHKFGGKGGTFRIESQLLDASTVSISSGLDFSNCTALDALVKVCDACDGHYVVKNKKVTIVPRQLESRYYWVSDKLHALLQSQSRRVAIEDEKADITRKKKNQRKAPVLNDEGVQEVLVDQLATYGVDLPELGGVVYDKKNEKLKVETSQQIFRELDRLYNVLIPVIER